MANSTQSGIGGGALVPGAGRDEDIWNDNPQSLPLPAPDLDDIRAAVAQAGANVNESAAMIAVFGQRLADLEAVAGFDATVARLDDLSAVVDHLQIRATEVERVLPEYRQAIHTLDARLTAVAQQISRNVRMAALDAAVKSRSPGEQWASVLKNAEGALRFIDPLPPPKPAGEGMDVAASDSAPMRH